MRSSSSKLSLVSTPSTPQGGVNNNKSEKSAKSLSSHRRRSSSTEFPQGTTTTTSSRRIKLGGTLIQFRVLSTYLYPCPTSQFTLNLSTDDKAHIHASLLQAIHGPNRESRSFACFLPFQAWAESLSLMPLKNDADLQPGTISAAAWQIWKNMGDMSRTSAASKFIGHVARINPEYLDIFVDVEVVQGAKKQHQQGSFTDPRSLPPRLPPYYSKTDLKLSRMSQKTSQSEKSATPRTPRGSIASAPNENDRINGNSNHTNGNIAATTTNNNNNNNNNSNGNSNSSVKLAIKELIVYEAAACIQAHVRGYLQKKEAIMKRCTALTEQSNRLISLLRRGVIVEKLVERPRKPVLHLSGLDVKLIDPGDGMGLYSSRDSGSDDDDDDNDDDNISVESSSPLGPYVLKKTRLFLSANGGLSTAFLYFKDDVEDPGRLGEELAWNESSGASASGGREGLNLRDINRGAPAVVVQEAQTQLERLLSMLSMDSDDSYLTAKETMKFSRHNTGIVGAGVRVEAAAAPVAADVERTVEMEKMFVADVAVVVRGLSLPVGRSHLRGKQEMVFSDQCISLVGSRTTLRFALVHPSALTAAFTSAELFALFSILVDKTLSDRDLKGRGRFFGDRLAFSHRRTIPRGSLMDVQTIVSTFQDGFGVELYDHETKRVVVKYIRLEEANEQGGQESSVGQYLVVGQNNNSPRRSSRSQNEIFEERVALDDVVEVRAGLISAVVDASLGLRPVRINSLMTIVAKSGCITLSFGSQTFRDEIMRNLQKLVFVHRFGSSG